MKPEILAPAGSMEALKAAVMQVQMQSIWEAAGLEREPMRIILMKQL